MDEWRKLRDHKLNEITWREDGHMLRPYVPHVLLTGACGGTQGHVGDCIHMQGACRVAFSDCIVNGAVCIPLALGATKLYIFVGGYVDTVWLHVFERVCGSMRLPSHVKLRSGDWSGWVPG